MENIECDFFIYGTGLTESILASVFSSENSVFHVDPNKYYGKDWASLGWNDLKNWAKTLNLLKDTVYRNAELIINNEDLICSSNAYSFNLTPSLIYSKSKIIDIIISLKLQPYLQLKSFDCALVYHESLDNPFFEIPYKKEMIAFREDIDFIWKRRIMCFIEFVLNITSEKNQKILEGREDDRLVDFLSSEPFALSTLYINMFVYGIAFSNTCDITVKQALPKIEQFFLSIELYTSFGILNCSYGGGSELIQAFSRNAALKGAVYILGKQITSCTMNDDDDNEKYPLIVVLNNNMKIKCKKLITSCQIENYQPSPILDSKPLIRSICLIKGNLSQIFQDKNIVLCSFPPYSLKSNEQPVQMIIHGSVSGDCPNGQYVIYTSTLDVASKAKTSILLAIETLIRATSTKVDEESKILFTLFYSYYPIIFSDHHFQQIIPVHGISLDIDFNQDIHHANHIYRSLFNKDLSFS
ncbi:hypothetical protein PCANB_001268 [Pneumocystis canis]|nr:hypothetical protein PCK1_001271 [Pneumocystis canis]KAG5436993.1 hypothetical protein PCANB_001268 [Pneumocystis canis]